MRGIDWLDQGGATITDLAIELVNKVLEIS